MRQTFLVQAQENRSIAGIGIRYRAVNVDQFKIFYREVGVRGAPTVLLLHGFPTASHIDHRMPWRHPRAPGREIFGLEYCLRV